MSKIRCYPYLMKLALGPEPDNDYNHLQTEVGAMKKRNTHESAESNLDEKSRKASFGEVFFFWFFFFRTGILELRSMKCIGKENKLRRTSMCKSYRRMKPDIQRHL